MKQELKKEFADRMIRSNRSELVVILYELIFAYFDDVREDFEKEDWEATKMDLDNAERVIRRLTPIFFLNLQSMLQYHR